MRAGTAPARGRSEKRSSLRHAGRKDVSVRPRQRVRFRLHDGTLSCGASGRKRKRCKRVQQTRARVCRPGHEPRPVSSAP